MNWRQLQKQKQIIMQKKIVLGADDFSYRDISAKRTGTCKRKKEQQMKHITKVRELYEETIHWISESEDSWEKISFPAWGVCISWTS